MNSPVPLPFISCANDYDPDLDSKYAYNCSFPNDSDPCALLHSLHKARDLRRIIFGYIPLPLSFIALILNIIYATAIIVAFRRGGVIAKKRYSFLLNRSFTDIAAVCLYYFIVVIWRVHVFSFSYVMTALFILIGGVSFLVLTGMYVAMTTVLYIAVTHPFSYKQIITVRRCCYMIAGIWIFSLAIAAVAGPFGATLFFPDTATIKCDYTGCQRPLVFFVVFLVCTCYFLVLLFYAIMLIKMHQSKKLVRTISARTKRRMSTMHRLGMNIGVFAVTAVPMAVVCITALSQLKTFSSLGYGMDHCKYILQADLFFKLEALAGAGAVLWVVRMLLDPVINCFTDAKFRAFVLCRPHVGRSAKVAPAAIEPTVVVLSPIGKDE